MRRSAAAWCGIGLGALGAVIGISIGLWTLFSGWLPFNQPREPLVARLDLRGPYVALVTTAAAQSYQEAVEGVMQLHPEAVRAELRSEDLASAAKILQEHQPRYVVVFITPDELDVNFAWQRLQLTTQLDDDPFVDVRTGFITGESPEAVTAFVRRIRAVAEGQVTLPAAFVDNLGPNTMARASAFDVMSGSFFLPVFSGRFHTTTISHGPKSFTQDRLGSMYNAGIVHFGGHGYPDRIEDGLVGTLARQLQLSPCVVFNGACYTGVTDRWLSMARGRFSMKRVAAGKCFCLGLLSNNVIGYLAALHPDHGIPVYQEMEYMAYRTSSLGDVIKHTHDGVILASGAKVPALRPLTDGMRIPDWTPSDIMIKGTAARILFGDPALVVMDGFTQAPFEVELTPQSDTGLLVKAVLKNPALKSTFTDTYFADLSADRTLFNDCARLVIELPQGWDHVGSVRVLGVTAAGKKLQHRLVGFGLEKDGPARRLHVQVDVPTTGYMQSELRQLGSQVELAIER